MEVEYEDLKNKCAIVTGASQGIGKSIAQRFCTAGMKVALFDINTDTLSATLEELKKNNPDAKIFSKQCDISNVESVEAAISEVRTSFAEIDILVNNAGLLIRAPLEVMNTEDWQKVLDVNLSGTYYCSRAVIDSMKHKGGGTIINVSSNVANVPSVGMGAYCLAKAAIETMTRVFAAELAPYNIRVNAYAPGVVLTDMTRDIIESRAEEKLRTIPLRRFAKPEDIASLVCFLSSEASAYVNGTVLSIDGGLLATHNPWKAWS